MPHPDPSPTERFSDRADAYARARPGYPTEAFEWIAEALPVAGVAVDVGAGTGLSALPLAETLPERWRVIAIEPNRAMRESAQAHDRVTWRDGTAEATGLGGGSCDLIVCAQAFHWFDGPRAAEEFRRALRDERGRVALLWNTHDTSRGEMAEYRDIMMRHATEPPTSPSCSGWKRADVSALSDSPTFGTVDRHAFANHQTLTREGLIDRALSSSYIPSEGAPADGVRTDLSAHFEKHQTDGLVRLSYDCVVYRAEALPR